MIPILIVFYGFDIKSAIGISNATIFVSAICRYVQNLGKSHPRKNGTGVLVDYNVAIVMLPSIVIGVIIGGIVNSTFPSVYLAIGLLVLLIVIISSTCRKLCQIQKKEATQFGPLCSSKSQDSSQEKGGQ